MKSFNFCLNVQAWALQIEGLGKGHAFSPSGMSIAIRDLQQSPCLHSADQISGAWACGRLGGVIVYLLFVAFFSRRACRRPCPFPPRLIPIRMSLSIPHPICFESHAGGNLGCKAHATCVYSYSLPPIFSKFFRMPGQESVE